jgi:hypothetical protein
MITRRFRNLLLVLGILCVTFATTGEALAQESKKHTPFSYDVNIGGMTPAGAAADSHSSSFLIGGGASLPLGRWVSLDWASMDFGFGTSGPSRTIILTDNSTRKTKNYQVMFSSGGRFNIPLGRSMALGLGGGYGYFAQNEYGVGRTYFNGVNWVTENINCTSCFRNGWQGRYLQARLYGRSDKYTGFGITAKYYVGKDANHSGDSYFRLPDQRWLSISLTFSFGI